MQINAVGEGDGHHGQPRNGLGPQGRQSRGAIDGVLDLLGDELLDLLRREPGRLGLDIHLRRNKFRKHIQRRIKRAPAAQNQREHGQCGDGAEAAHAQRDNAPHRLQSASVLGFISRASNKPAAAVTTLSPAAIARVTK